MISSVCDIIQGSFLEPKLCFLCTFSESREREKARAQFSMKSIFSLETHMTAAKH